MRRRVVAVVPNPDEDDLGEDVAVQPDWRIVVAGFANTTLAEGGDDFGLMRFLPGGTLDTSFSGDGKQSTDFFANEDHALGVALGGGIVAVGDATDASFHQRIAVARYKAG